MKTFNHTQSTAAAVWTINHNLNAYPSVEIARQYLAGRTGVLTKPAVVLPESIVYVDANTIRVTFSSPQIGTARLAGSFTYEHNPHKPA
jgi:hypothetical protein